MTITVLYNIKKVNWEYTSFLSKVVYNTPLDMARIKGHTDIVYQKKTSSLDAISLLDCLKLGGYVFLEKQFSINLGGDHTSHATHEQE